MPSLMRKLPAFLVALVALVAVSCNTNDGPVDPGTTPNAPTSLQAQSRSETAVALQWNASASGVSPSGYRVLYNVKSSAVTDSITVTGATSTTAVVTGLTFGVIYEFSVKALNGSTASVASGSIEWAPAKRSGILKLYSGFNPAEGSGLVVFENAPAVASINQGRLWDLAFDDVTDPSRPHIASPGQTAYVNNSFEFSNGQVAKTVYLGRQYTNISSLDEIWETTDLDDDSLNKEKFYDLSSIGGTGSFGFVFASRAQSGIFTYGKALVIRTNNTFIQGSGTNKYIEVQVSYQTNPSIPYALRAKMEATALNRAGEINVNAR
ncbi:MAG: fibronectin type III domain-containing protein [bacterium]|nr:fibronectin type III domain-containing protein [bacterium]